MRDPSWRIRHYDAVITQVMALSQEWQDQHKQIFATPAATAATDSGPIHQSFLNTGPPSLVAIPRHRRLPPISTNTYPSRTEDEGAASIPNRHASLTSNITTPTNASQAFEPHESPSHVQAFPDPLRCPTCNNPYSGKDRKTNLRRHERQKHEGRGKEFPCLRCSLDFWTRDSLKRHNRIKHGAV